MATKRSRPTKSKGFSNTNKTDNKFQTALTPAGKQLLEQIAEQLNVSVAEAVEQMAQGKLAVAGDHAETAIAVKTATEGAAAAVSVAETATWQQQLAEKDQEIAKLKKQLGQQEEFQQNYQSTSLQNQQQSMYIDELEQARAKQRQELQQLNHQLNQLQAQLAQEESSRQTAIADKNGEIAAKDRQIEKLKAQVQNLQGLASIGERELSRWRFNSIK